MIKAGQIYKHKYSPEMICITYIEEGNVRGIRPDGQVKVYTYFTELDVDLWWELIAEYPTWQEAVNSKEFKND